MQYCTYLVQCRIRDLQFYRLTQNDVVEKHGFVRGTPVLSDVIVRLQKCSMSDGIYTRCEILTGTLLDVAEV